MPVGRDTPPHWLPSARLAGDQLVAWSAALAGEVGVEARHVVEHAELDHPVGDLSPGRSTAQDAGSYRQA